LQFHHLSKNNIDDINPKAGATKARNVYVGPFAKKYQQYAETFYPGAWCILSAKHGFLFPDDKVPGPYNVTFNKKATKPIGIEVLANQARKKGLDKFRTIVVIGGRNYVGKINEVFKEKIIETPLKGCKGMGYMMGKMNDAIKIKNLI
jgi:hypothetical protein